MHSGYKSEIESALDGIANLYGFSKESEHDALRHGHTTGHITSFENDKGKLIVTLNTLLSETTINTNDRINYIKNTLQGASIEDVEIIPQFAEHRDGKIVVVTNPEKIEECKSGKNSSVYAADKLVVTLPNDKSSLDKIEAAHETIRKDIAKKCLAEALSEAKNILKPLGFRADKVLSDILKEQGAQPIAERVKS